MMNAGNVALAQLGTQAAVSPTSTDQLHVQGEHKTQSAACLH